VLYEVTANGSQYVLVGNPPVTLLTATVSFSPKTLNVDSSGAWVTCRIGLPDGYRVDDIDVGKVCITAVNGDDNIAPTYLDSGSLAASGKTLMAKFSRQRVEDLVTGMLPQGPSGRVDMVLTVSGTGKITSTNEIFRFSGADAIAVKADAKNYPK